MDFSRSSTGSIMVQSVFPNKNLETWRQSDKEPRRLGIELALPLTLLALILFAEYSPLLKLHQERIVEWLCEHDYVAYATAVYIALIPFWMIYVMLTERKAGKNSRSSRT